MPVFLAPWFLLAAAAATIPVALHLLWRRKPQAVPFSTLRFLRAAVVRTRRSRRLNQWLLLALRVLILLCLALAFARPKLGLRAAGAGGGQRSVLIVLDATASMHYQHGATSAFELAQKRAGAVLDSLGESDKAAIIAPGLPDPFLIMPPTADKAKLRAALAAAKPGYAWRDLAHDLRSVVENPPPGLDPRDLEIHVCSDFQEPSWPAAQLAALAPLLATHQTPLFLNQIRPEAVANVGVRHANFQPPALFAAEPVSATVEVATSADWVGPVTASLLLDGVLQDTRPLSVSEPGENGRSILHGIAPESRDGVTATVQLGEDAYAPDNQYLTVLSRDSGVPVWLVRDQAADSLFIAAAIQPGGGGGPGFRVEEVDWATLAAREPPPGCLLVLCNPPQLDPALLQKIEALLKNGSTALFFPGANGGMTDAGFLAWQALGGLAITEEAVVAPEPVVLLPTDAPSDVERRLRGIVRSPPSFPFNRRLRFATPPATAEFALEYPDRAPFLVGLPCGAGALWLSSVAAERSWSDFPITPFFLILQQEILRAAAAKLHPPLQTVVGGTLPLPWPEPVLERAFTWIAPSGRIPPRRGQRRNLAEPFLLDGFTEPGVWRLETGVDNAAPSVAVNLPPEEAALTYASLAESARRLAPVRVLAAETAAAQEENLRLARFGRPVWPALLAAAFLLAAAELALANHAAKTI